jgi:hypothetical protein
MLSRQRRSQGERSGPRNLHAGAELITRLVGWWDSNVAASCEKVRQARVNMVNPLEIMPVLALAVMIAFIPLLGDCPEPSKETRRARLEQ